MKTNDPLQERLRQAMVPARSPGYWEHFPRRVMARLERAEPASSHVNWTAWRWAAAACVLMVAAAAAWQLRPRVTPGTDYAKLVREIAKEFPGQLKAIVVDGHGMRVELADSPSVPVSSPVLVEVCRAQQDCRKVITFSGQEIKVNGEPWDVLVNGEGRVIVAGRSTGKYKIAAHRLEEL